MIQRPGLDRCDSLGSSYELLLISSLLLSALKMTAELIGLTSGILLTIGSIDCHENL